MSSRSKKYFYNTVFTALLQIVNMISGFVVPKIMLQYYGSEINGLVTSITQFISYFNLVEAGLSSAAIYALYKPLADKDTERVSRIVAASKRFYIQSGYVFTALTIVLAIIYPLYISTEQYSPMWIAFLVIVLGSNGFLEFFTLSKYRVLLTADQKTYVVSIASLIQVVTQMLVIVCLSPLGLNVVWVRAIAIAAILLRSVILYLYCKRNYPQINYNAEPDTKALNKRWDALFLQILGAVHKGTTVVLLTVIVKDLALISVYTVYHVVVGGMNSILEIFNSGLTASFGEVIACNQKQTLQKAYKEFEFVFYSLSGLLFSVASVMIMPFVGLYTRGVHDANYNMPLVAYLMLLDGFLYHAKTPQGMLVLAAGMYKETKWRSFTQSMIALVGGIILAFPLGIYGVLTAAILSNVYRTLDLYFFAGKYITGLSPKQSMTHFFLAVFEMLLIILPFNFIHVECSTWMEWLLISCGVGVYALAVVGLLSVVFKRKLTQDVVKRVQSIVMRKAKRRDAI